MKVALFSSKNYDQEFFEKANISGSHQLYFFETSLNIDTISLTQGFDAVCIFVNDFIDEPTIKKLVVNGIKVIALRCAGFNNIDIDAAKANGIKVVRVPAYSPQAVAEHAVALILTLNRKTHKAFNRVRENNFSLENLTGFNLYGKTVGVVGTGIIGTAFCKIMLGFGCKVIAYDVQPSDALKKLGVDYQTFDSLICSANIISLHCPLNEQTQHLMNTKVFDKMKPGSMLINTGRGALLNTADALDALKDEKLAYLGIDVYEQEAALFFRDLSETINQDELFMRLLTFPNVLITAHQGFFTKEALTEISNTTLQNLSDFENGLKLVNEVALY